MMVWFAKLPVAFSSTIPKASPTLSVQLDVHITLTLSLTVDGSVLAVENWGEVLSNVKNIVLDTPVLRFEELSLA